MITKETKEFYSIQEVADLLQVHPETVRVYIRQGKIKAVKMNQRLYRIPITEISYLFPKEADNVTSS